MNDSTRPGLSVRLRQDTPIPLDAEFTCGPGEVLALVGPSGSGKSTILRCIAGLHTPPDGHVAAGGAVWLDSNRNISLRPQARSAGIVFQHYALFPHMSALDNVAAAAGHLPGGDAARRARELLGRVHLQGLERRRPGNLSGGQQQRVALARALARDPAVLLLDEPFSSVDQVTREKLHRELALLRRGLVTPVVLVTHDLNEAATLADRLCVLHRGRTLQAGPPIEVINRPLNPLVARLVGLRNIFQGRVLEVSQAGGKISWPGGILEVASTGGFGAGDPVTWVVPPSGVILHRADRPSNGEKENPVRGVIGETLNLGESVMLSLIVDGQERTPLTFAVPTHVARRNRVASGRPAAVSLVTEAIHVMEQDSDRE